MDRTRTRKNPTKKKKPRRRLMPVMRPQHNMRELIKQLVLLEDHLVQREHRCKDCIRKHFLCSEGLAQEALTLARPGPASLMLGLPPRLRVLHHAWETNHDDAHTRSIAARLRRMRKQLMPAYARLPLRRLPTREAKRVLALAA